MYRDTAGEYVIHAGEIVAICSTAVETCSGAFIGKPSTSTMDILHDTARYTEVSLPDNAETLLLTLLQEFCKHVADSDR